MKVSLKGATVGLAGKVKGYSKNAVGEQVSTWGASQRPSPVVAGGDEWWGT